MKRILFIIAFLLGLAAASHSAPQSPVTGRVVDSEGVAVEFANVIFMRDSVQVRGVASDSDGRFRTTLPEGRYRVLVQLLGYETEERSIEIASTADCGEFVLRPQENRLDEVVVRAPVVRREADRFVVDVANALSAVGKDGVELLQQAPGVWIDDERIQINGRSGSKVYVDGRELRMEKSQLLQYLRSLQATDIQRIEVVPQSGADHDADSSGGIIMITLRRRREDGMMGTATLGMSHSSWGHDYWPNVHLNYHKNRLDLYTRINASFRNSTAESVENTLYSAAALGTSSHLEESIRSGGGTLGAIYEIADRHSIGIEAEYADSGENSRTASLSDYSHAVGSSQSDSRYVQSGGNDRWTATLNYVWKIDTLGSTFKILSDYTRRISTDRHDCETQTSYDGGVRDSLYRDNTCSDYGIFSVTAALDKHFSPHRQLRAGVKYTRNDLYNNALYEYMQDDAWIENTLQRRRTDYAENIAAAYAAVSATMGRWSVVAGLRGEYTAMISDDRTVDSRYFSLFPNANISCSLTADGSHMLVVQYSRTISRPGFWEMSPVRTQISEFTYTVGNPDLLPSYSNRVTLNYVLKSKYTFSASADLQRGTIEQQTEVDPSNPLVLRVIPRNFGRFDIYSFSAVLPFTLTRWWTFNTTLAYHYMGQNLPMSSEIISHHMFQAQASMTFALPRGFMIDAEYMGLNRMRFGNTSVGPIHRVSCALKKRFFDNRLTASLGVDNILNRKQMISIDSGDFRREMQVRQLWDSRMVNFRISYNFRAGKAFRNRSVESGAAEEKSRL